MALVTAQFMYWGQNMQELNLHSNILHVQKLRWSCCMNMVITFIPTCWGIITGNVFSLPCVQGLHLCKMGTKLWEILLIRCFIRLSLTLWAAWKHLLDILIEIFLFQNTPLLLQIPILETLIKGAVFQSKAVLRELIYPEKIMS